MVRSVSMVSGFIFLEDMFEILVLANWMRNIWLRESEKFVE